MSADTPETDWQSKLTPEQFRVARGGDTERAFTGKYWNCHEDGVYRCVCCGSELFRSDEKYDSGSGWPSFWRTNGDDRVKIVKDTSQGMVRDEIRCAKCDAHLGHLFDDGPLPTGLRFCVNSASLDLAPKEPAKKP
ncbi:MAG: peptide-methionine (R)-S-oxide reductase MsrB [Candidatus Eisenbacteria bacterium]